MTSLQKNEKLSVTGVEEGERCVSYKICERQSFLSMKREVT